MCGTAGLFVGCPLAPKCPRSLLRPSAEVIEGQDTYRSPLASWSERASVRSRPERRLEGRLDWERLFPRDLVPVSLHPLVEEGTPEIVGRLVARHLLRYLDFTAKLEHLVVNRTALSFAQGMTGFEVPDDMRLDAYRIYCDEAYHALFSATLSAEVSQLTAISGDEETAPYFLRRLDQILASCDGTLAPLIEILFVICSETLISSTLLQVGASDDVDRTVQAVIDDHARDESRHHAYFAAVLRQIWPQLSRSAQRDAGPMVPALIQAFLFPDLVDLESELVGYGFTPDQAKEILSDTYPESVLQSSSAVMARYTVQHFRAVGAMDDPATADAFARAGLIGPDGREDLRPLSSRRSSG